MKTIQKTITLSIMALSLQNCAVARADTTADGKPWVEEDAVDFKASPSLEGEPAKTDIRLQVYDEKTRSWKETGAVTKGQIYRVITIKRSNK